VEITRPHPNELAPETPEELRPLLHFLNSRPIGFESEGLADAPSAGAYLRASGFDLADADLGAEDLALLRRMRDALTVILQRDDDGAPIEAAWDSLREIAAESPVVIVAGPGPRTTLEPTGRGARGVVERVLVGVHGAIAAGRFERLRLCAFEPCSGAFYDATRSRTQRWHSYATCGNRVNVAAHRKRVSGA
jgi:predicted RNA-binding Zn ribbon-like protein